MKFYPNKVIKTIHGEPMKTQGKDGPMDLTLGWAAIEVLMGEAPNDRGAPSNLKIERYKLAMKIKGFMAGMNENGVMSVPAEQLAMIKTRVLDCYATPVAGAFCELVELESPHDVTVAKA